MEWSKGIKGFLEWAKNLAKEDPLLLYSEPNWFNFFLARQLGAKLFNILSDKMIEKQSKGAEKDEVDINKVKMWIILSVQKEQ